MNFIGTKNIETERLELKIQTMEEQKRLWELLQIEDISKYYLVIPKKFVDKFKDWNIQKKYYQDKTSKSNNDDVFQWSIFLKNTDIVIGYMSCQEELKTDSSVRGVGWFLDPKYQKQGYMYEAANAILNYMFNEVDIKEIRTGAAIVNPNSWKLLEKLGFKRMMSTFYNDYTLIEKPVECYSYRITKEEYLEFNNEKQKR